MGKTKWLGALGALVLMTSGPSREARSAAAPPVAPCITITSTINGSTIESCQPISASNPMPISGTFSATLSGFLPTPAYATLSVGAASSSVALPGGTSVIVYNTGAHAAFVKLGDSSVTASAGNDVVQPGSWLAFTVGANTYLAAIEVDGATSLNLSGGAGLPTGAGGGSGGSGGGGAITAPLGHGTADASAVSVVPSATASFAVTAASLPLPSGAATSALQTTGNSELTTINSTLGTPMQQSGGSVTANLGTLNGAATNAELVTINGTLGTPMQQTGGSVTLTQTGFNALTGGVAIDSSHTLFTQLVGNSNIAYVDGSHDLLVTCSNCSGTGASATDNLTGFSPGTSVLAPAGGFYQATVTSNPATAGNLVTAQMTHYRAFMMDWYNSSGVEMGTGGSPVQVANGGTFATQSAITAASGAIASGAIASGAIASGAFAAGSISSGAAVSGAFADGALAQIGVTTLAKSTATDTTSVAVIPLLKEISYMEQNPASRAVTNGGTFATQSAITAASGSIASGAIASGAIASGAIASGAAVSGAFADGAITTIGAKADAKSAATDTTPVSEISALKEISYMEQNPVSRAVTNGGTFATQSAITAAASSISANAFASGALPTGAIADLALAQGSTTSGEVGNLILTATTTGAPSYTTGKSNPLSTDTAGNLRTACVSGCNGVIATDNGGFIYGSSNYSPVGGVYNSAITPLTSGSGGAAAMTANRSIHVLDDNSASLLTAVQSPIPMQAGTVSIGGVSVLGWGSSATSLGAPTTWGTAPTGNNVVGANADVLAMATTIPGQALANPSWSYITDGTSTASVKAASTSATATDKSLVVQINPQQTPPVSVSQINGSAVSTAASGIQKVGVVGNGGVAFDKTATGAAATNSVQIEGVASGTAVPVSLGANQSVNVAQVNGHTVVEATTSGVQKVGVVGGAGVAFDAAPEGTLPTNGLLNGGSVTTSAPTYTTGKYDPLSLTTAGALRVDNSGVTQPVSGADPCFASTKTTAAFSSSSGEFIIVTHSSTLITRICAITYRMGGTAGTAVSIVSGSGSTCVTSPTALSGSTTAANGLLEAQYGGEAYGSGSGTIMKAGAGGDDICILQSSTQPIAGSVTYVQAN